MFAWCQLESNPNLCDPGQMLHHWAMKPFMVSRLIVSSDKIVLKLKVWMRVHEFYGTNKEGLTFQYVHVLSVWTLED